MTHLLKRRGVELIVSIPGIKNLSAHVIVSEIGIDMSRFPSAAHLHLLGLHMSAQ
jgi:transposase